MEKHRRFAMRSILAFAIGLGTVGFSPGLAWTAPPGAQVTPEAASQSGPTQLFLPVIQTAGTSTVPGPNPGPVSTRRVNAPFFDGEVRYPETAIFWYGRVRPDESYTDVRVGYSQAELFISLAVIDRRIWFDESPSSNDLTAWDSATLLLDTGSGSPYRMDAQFRHDTLPMQNYQKAYRDNGSGWQPAAIPFSSSPAWRGDSPNNDRDDKGWVIAFHIPFSSLGLSSPLGGMTKWRLALATHNRNTASGPALQDKTWPEAMDTAAPATWGELVFGLPAYVPPSGVPAGSITIRQRLNGATVSDAGVGGYSRCGQGTDYWATWGDTNEGFYNPERSDFNIQNQSDISDYPCFSKYYVTFPLSPVPAGKKIVSASLTLHQLGGSDPVNASKSFIQVLCVGVDWDDHTLTWNNAPLAVENYGGIWVDRMLSSDWPGFPGIARTWDVTRAVAEAYSAGKPLRLAMYTSDNNQNSGKYFTTSDTGGSGTWNAEGRPTLEVSWAN